MKILVTGGAGFIGSALIRLAIERGHSVVNVDNLSYAACLDNIAPVAKHPNYSFEQVDVCDLPRINSVFMQHLPDAVMHLAAESHVDRSIDSPYDFVKTNVNGTFNLLEASLSYWKMNDRPTTFRFHHISTDEVFGSLSSNSATLFTEDTPYDPRSPYSASKASSDHLVRAWYKTYGLPVIITNCSNNYGPYHFPEKLIPVVIINALAGKALPIYGDGSNIRDWLYVDDHVNALLLVLQKGVVGRSYNIGSESEISNLDLVNNICTILDHIKPRDRGSYSDLIKFVANRPGHDKRYAIDPSRIRNELGWQPVVSFDEGLKLTIRWYLENEDWWRPLLKRSGVDQRLGIKA